MQNEIKQYLLIIKWQIYNFIKLFSYINIYYVY